MVEQIGNVIISTFGACSVPVCGEESPVERSLLEALEAQKPIAEILKQDRRWPVLLQLSPVRKNIVQPMAIQRNSRVLELGGGMGAVTAALVSRCAQVDSVVESLTEGRANAYRNRDCSNLHIHVGKLGEFEAKMPYDVLLLLGGLENAPCFFPGDDPFRNMLAFCRRMLKPGGLLYVGVNNRLGARYLAGCREEHENRFFGGLESCFAAGKPHAFTRSELSELVLSCGFGELFFYYPLPDYILPKMIYSDSYLPQNDLSFPYRCNYDSDRLVCFEEVRLLRSLGATAEFGMLANSFLLEAVAK